MIGRTESVIKCSECNFESPTTEWFESLEIPIISHDGTHASLEDGLDAYFAEKIANYQLRCTNCSRLQKTSKLTKTTLTKTISRIPDVVVVHIKRVFIFYCN
jgi:ubiquitin C-terminal hydrolase